MNDSMLKYCLSHILHLPFVYNQVHLLQYALRDYSRSYNTEQAQKVQSRTS